MDIIKKGADPSHKINDEVTLDIKNLNIIYNAVHGPRVRPFIDTEIKGMVGWVRLQLDSKAYKRLDMTNVIGRLRQKDDVLTKAVKPYAEDIEKQLTTRVNEYYTKYVEEREVINSPPTIETVMAEGSGSKK